MKRKLYQEMANTIIARTNCIKSGNAIWKINHELTLDKLLDKLPHGSGLNYTWSYDFIKSNGNKIILHMAYDSMLESGMYDRVINFILTITPSLTHEIDLLITGNFGKYQDIKDYLYDILNESLTSEIEI